jgi:hypothetical protein
MAGPWEKYAAPAAPTAAADGPWSRYGAPPPSADALPPELAPVVVPAPTMVDQDLGPVAAPGQTPVMPAAPTNPTGSARGERERRAFPA